MKRKKNLFFFLYIGLIPILNGCITPKNDFPDPTAEPPYLEVRSQITLLNSGGIMEVDVSTNDPNWTSRVDKSWVSLEPIVGTPGKLKLIIAANDVMDERLANITLTTSGGELEKTIRVIQFGTAKKIHFQQNTTTITSLNITAAASSFNLDLVTNCPTFTFEVIQTDDWLTVTEPTPNPDGFTDQTLTYQFAAVANTSTESSRTATIKVIGTGLAEGAVAEFIIEQSPNVVMSLIPAKLLAFDGPNNGSAIANMFDNDFGTFAETSYSIADGAATRTLDIEVKADKLFQILYYTRQSQVTTASLGRRSQYPADMELWVQYAGSATWTKIKNVEIRGTDTQQGTKHYPPLKLSEIPFPIYDGAALLNVRKVRLVITKGNSATGENNQFWNSDEIRFNGVPSLIPDPVKVPIINGFYSWISMDDLWPGSDGGPVPKLYDDIITADNYWQTPYFDCDEEDAEGVGKVGATADAIAAGTTLQFTLDKAYSNLSEIRWYTRNDGTQVPKSFEIWVDAAGNGQFKLVKSFAAGAIPIPWAVPILGTVIKLDEPVKAKAFQIFVKETGSSNNAMFMCATEIEAYIQP